MKKIYWEILEKLAILVVIISGIIASIYYLWGGLKMVWSLFTIQITSFWLIIAIWFFIAVLMGVNMWNRKRKEEELRTLKSKHDKEVQQSKSDSEVRTRQLEEEMKHLGSELEDKTKQYNDLLSETRLPKPVEELLIIEKAREPSIHASDHTYDFPTLRFLLRVINYTYYSFEPKEVEIEYYCGSKKVGQNIGSTSTLPKCGDGNIDCKYSVEKKYSDSNKWVIKCSVVYARWNKEYVIKKDLHYTLSKSIHDKLKQRVEEALTKGE